MHPIRLKILYVPRLTKILFAVYLFTKKYHISAKIQHQFSALIYNQDGALFPYKGLHVKKTFAQNSPPNLTLPKEKQQQPVTFYTKAWVTGQLPFC
jgi:hypothetical protein